jgi:hypothetical protein
MTPFRGTTGHETPPISRLLIAKPRRAKLVNLVIANYALWNSLNGISRLLFRLAISVHCLSNPRNRLTPLRRDLF